MKSRLMDFLSVIALIYFLLLIFLYLNQRNMMYHPNTHIADPAAYGASRDIIVSYQTQDSISLNSWYFAGRPEKPVILYFQGNAGHIGDRISKVKNFINKGYGVLLAGYRGYGGNPGNPSEQGFYQDARAAIAFLKANGYSQNKIILYGESIGSGVATQMATEGQFSGLVLEAPFTSIVDVAQSKYFYAPVRLLLKDQYDNLYKIKNIHLPLLIIHGTEDQTVPIHWGHALASASNPPKRFVSLTGAGHGNLYDFGADLHVLEFLEKIYGTTGTQPQ